MTTVGLVVNSLQSSGVESITIIGSCKCVHIFASSCQPHIQIWLYYSCLAFIAVCQQWMRMKQWKLMYDQMLLTWTLNSCLAFSISLINVCKFMSVTGWYLPPPILLPHSPTSLLSFSIIPSLSIHVVFVWVLASGSVKLWYLSVILL